MRPIVGKGYEKKLINVAAVEKNAVEKRGAMLRRMRQTRLESDHTSGHSAIKHLQHKNKNLTKPL